MDHTFTYSFPENRKNSISYDLNEDEKVDVSFEGGYCFLSANRPGFLLLAKLFLQMSMGDYEPGFHIHLNKNFSDDGPEILVPTLVAEDAV